MRSVQEGARLSDHACSAGPHIPASPVVLNCGHAVCGLITPLGLHSCSSPHQLLDACPECQAKVPPAPAACSFRSQSCVRASKLSRTGCRRDVRALNGTPAVVQVQTAPVVCAKLARLLEQLFPEAYAERSAQLQGKTEAIQASVDAGQGLLAEAAEPGPSTSAEAEAPVEVVNVDPPTPGAQAALAACMGLEPPLGTGCCAAASAAKHSAYRLNASYQLQIAALAESAGACAGQGPLHPVDVLRKQIADTMLDFTHHGCASACGSCPLKACCS